MSETSYTRRKYKKDFLDKVIVRIDFDISLPISKQGLKNNIYKRIKELFPITEEKKVLGKEFLIGPDVAKQRSVESKEWHYCNINRNKHLLISPNTMFIEYSKYEYYEQLIEDFTSVSDAIFDAYPNIKAKRIGLRYIDKIHLNEDNPTAWAEYLKPELSSIFSIADDIKTVCRAFHVLEFNYGEDLLRFQFGMFNPDHPAPIRKKEYILDFDMFATKLLDKNDIKPTLDRFHIKVNKSFEEVITDKLREIMEPINE